MLHPQILKTMDLKENKVKLLAKESYNSPNFSLFSLKPEIFNSEHHM